MKRSTSSDAAELNGNRKRTRRSPTPTAVPPIASGVPSPTKSFDKQLDFITLPTVPTDDDERSQTLSRTLTPLLPVEFSSAPPEVGTFQPVQFPGFGSGPNVVEPVRKLVEIQRVTMAHERGDGVDKADGTSAGGVDGEENGVDGPAVQSKEDLSEESTPVTPAEDSPAENGMPMAKVEDLKDSGRIFVSGLDATVTEFMIKKAFEKFGAISKNSSPPQIDFLWHKSGPHKGQPRGFCFLQYKDGRPCAEAAIAGMSGKVFYGRKLRVDFPERPKVEPRPQGASWEGEMVGQLPRQQFRSKKDKDAYKELVASINPKLQPKKNLS
ncbi:putative RNA-binding protein 18, partial [Irineochytrium annulatum]